MRAGYDVLLVEDEAVVRAAVERILRPEGLTLDRVEDVDGALARLRKVEHRVVLSDLMLPGFSGFDLLERVTGERPQVPVILITGYATIENALAAFKKGAFDFLPKPFDVPELLGVVRRALKAVESGSWNAVPREASASCRRAVRRALFPRPARLGHVRQWRRHFRSRRVLARPDRRVSARSSCPRRAPV